jgi:protein TonB
LSIGSASEPIATADQELHSSNISPQIIEDFVPDELLSSKNEPSLVQSEEISFPDFISDNVESNNSTSNSDQSVNQKISVGNDPGKSLPEIKEAVPVEHIVPVYPFRARKKGFEGVVTLDVTVSDIGIPDSCQIINSSGYKELDDAAVKTVLASLFYPGTVDGEEIQSILRILIKFQLNDP